MTTAPLVRQSMTTRMSGYFGCLKRKFAVVPTHTKKTNIAETSPNPVQNSRHMRFNLHWENQGGASQVPCPAPQLYNHNSNLPTANESAVRRSSIQILDQFSYLALIFLCKKRPLKISPGGNSKVESL